MLIDDNVTRTEQTVWKALMLWVFLSLNNMQRCGELVQMSASSRVIGIVNIMFVCILAPIKCLVFEQNQNITVHDYILIINEKKKRSFLVCFQYVIIRIIKFTSKVNIRSITFALRVHHWYLNTCKTPVSSVSFIRRLYKWYNIMCCVLFFVWDIYYHRIAAGALQTDLKNYCESLRRNPCVSAILRKANV